MTFTFSIASTRRVEKSHGELETSKVCAVHTCAVNKIINLYEKDDGEP